MSIFSNWFRREIEQSVSETITKVLDDKLPGMIERFVGEKLEETPDVELSNAGFGWAISIALRKHWPDVDGQTAARWMWDYIDVPYGTEGYAWTYAAAQDIAREYVGQFGEAA